MSEIPRLCRQYTKLSEKDIEILVDFEKSLPIVAEAQGCDVFIDCLTMDPNAAIVVSEYRPKDSLYQNTVVGMLAHRSDEPAAIRTLETGVPSRGLKALTQEQIDIVQNVSAIRGENDRIIGVFIMEQSEVTPFYRAHREDGVDRTMEYLVENTPGINITTYVNDAVLYFNFEGITIYTNPRAQLLYKNLGYRDNITGLPFQNLVFGNVKFSDIVEKEWLDINSFVIGDYVLKIQYHLMKDQDVPLGVVMLITDVTDVHNKENELILKSVVIKEIHHRVKNNLQTVASLLRLQSRRVKDPDMKKMLQENINRTLSIALTHEILAQNGVDEVYIKEVLEKLTKYVVQSVAPSHQAIEAEVLGDNFKVKSDIATSVSLVVNELLQNCFDHAFHGRQTGRIEINIQKSQLHSTITITDNGTGFHEGPTNSQSLGLQIVRSMITDKLGGFFNLESGELGTKATFTFAHL